MLQRVIGVAQEEWGSTLNRYVSQVADLTETAELI